jgi:hypothetical protein
VRVRAVELSYRPLKTKLQRMAEQKISSLVESVPCEIGYWLVRRLECKRGENPAAAGRGRAAA